MKRPRKLIFTWSLLALLVLVGCDPGIKQAVYSKPVWTVENPNATKESQKERLQRASRDTIGEGPSSLDALRQGRSTATPASSPVQDIYFDFDSFDLRADARNTLRANAEWMKNNPSARVEVEGHCDERGTNEYNLALGAKRAQSARDYLVTLGIAANRLSTISFGEEVPLCTVKTEACWQKNRRGRFVIAPLRPAS
jgi:peptidoglycan-associated lipoprotein